MSHVVTRDFTSAINAMPGSRRLPLIGMFAATLLVSACGEHQYMAALVEPEPQTLSPLEPAKPMAPERKAWLKERCAQLIAYLDRYSSSRPNQNSDGRYNHTRIGAEIECDRGHYHKGIDTMTALLKGKNFGVPKPGKPPIEPEDD